jgi:hypothetical protein
MSVNPASGSKTDNINQSSNDKTAGSKPAQNKDADTTPVIAISPDKISAQNNVVTGSIPSNMFGNSGKTAGTGNKISNFLSNKFDGPDKNLLKDLEKKDLICLQDVWTLVTSARDINGISQKEYDGLKSFLDKNKNKFSPEAAEALGKIISEKNIVKPESQVPQYMKEIWKKDISWTELSLDKPAISGKEALDKGKTIFSITPEQTRKEAQQLADWSKKYPSNAASQVPMFHAQWAISQTFQELPAQAFLYHDMLPFNDKGQAKNEFWKAYQDSVEAGMPENVIEEAYLRAHINDFKTAIQSDKFKQLYSLTDKSYKGIIVAYVDAMKNFEEKLDKGVEAKQVSRFMFTDTMGYLVKRGSILGFPQNDKGEFITGKNLLKPYLNLKDPLSHEVWKSIKNIGTDLVFDTDTPKVTPTKVIINLTKAQADKLNAQTGLKLKPGINTLDEQSIAGAAVAEPDRGNKAGEPLKKYPLKLEDFTELQHLRSGQRMSGTDGVMDFNEMQGVIRNVQARVRSQHVFEFFKKYPAPEAGILTYSANMLAINGAYGQSEMFGALANGIMPVDNNGKPKNELWQAYADKYEEHYATGRPSKDVLEGLWFKAHMKDFDIVDTPDFKVKLNEFWKQAIEDPALRPMAIYTEAMVGGRKIFEQAKVERVPDETAFARSFKHFATTMIDNKTFPFWQNDLKELGKLATGKYSKQAELDQRGLPTDKTLVIRTMQGIKEMTGLTRILKDGFNQTTFDKTRIAAAAPTKMVDLSTVLSPEKLKKVDPKVIEFYKNPGNFNITVGIEMPQVTSKILFGASSLISDQGDIPDRVKGFEGYPLEMSLYNDQNGKTHWDRNIIVDGKQRHLFHAVFEAEGNQVKETFKVKGQETALYFNVEPYKGGIRLSLDKKKSSKLASVSNITFTTTPQPNGLKTIGAYESAKDVVSGKVEFHIQDKVPLFPD